MRGLVIGSLLVAVAGCGVARNVGGAVGIGSASARGSNRLEVNGVTYRSRLDIDGEARRDLTITVRPFRADPEMALEAGRYRATVYCLRRFGSSETAWAIGPDTPLDWDVKYLCLNCWPPVEPMKPRNLWCKRTGWR